MTLEYSMCFVNSVPHIFRFSFRVFSFFLFRAFCLFYSVRFCSLPNSNSILEYGQTKDGVYRPAKNLLLFIESQEKSISYFSFSSLLSLVLSFFKRKNRSIRAKTSTRIATPNMKYGKRKRCGK